MVRAEKLAAGTGEEVNLGIKEVKEQGKMKPCKFCGVLRCGGGPESS
jgi:hypothetical protein